MACLFSWWRRGVSIVASVVLVMSVSSAVSVASAAELPTHRAGSARKEAHSTASPAAVAPSKRDRVMPEGWRDSSDRAVALDGDGTGLHVLVADARDGYAWRTAATLSEPGTQTSQWIGQMCVTGSGNRAVVVYAPRQMVNRPAGFRRGGLAAVVDLRSGAVTKLSALVSLAYFDPGCGTGETAILTSTTKADDGGLETRLLTVDAAHGTISDSVTVPGQVTSAVTYQGQIAAARGNRLVAVDADADGSVRTLATLASTPFRLVTDGHGGVGYEVQTGKATVLHRYEKGHDQAVARVAKNTARLHQHGGRVFIQGRHATQHVKKSALPAGWRAVNTSPRARLSTEGVLAVTGATNKHERATAAPKPQPQAPLPISIDSHVLPTGAKPHFTVRPAALKPGEGAAPSPALTTSKPQVGPNATSGDPAHTTIDLNRTCAIPRNDPHIQSLQPSPQMGEWAADLAVTGALTIQRPAGWNGSDLPSYSPQGLFPSHSLVGGGHVPAQVLLGVMAQESNIWQASKHITDGRSGNFEQGGFYGRYYVNGRREVNFRGADCGYGATQVTTGMRRGDTKYTHEQQLALTVDYAANIAAGLQILQDKWNKMQNLGMTVNDNDPSKIENWWYALWAYNSGWHAQGSDPTGQYGLGWTNNMANDSYPPDRNGFLADSYGDAKYPNHWSYPERVMGWARHPLLRLNWKTGTYHQAYRAGTWPTHSVPPDHHTVMKEPARPPLDEFCTDANQCDSSTIDQQVRHCTRTDFKCWWHQPVTWVDCDSTGPCGTEDLRYHPGDPEPTANDILYYPDCSRGLPADVLLIDDVPSGAGPQSDCSATFTNDGSLAFEFHEDQLNPGTYLSKLDFHQSDGGLGGHFWFAHAWENNGINQRRRVTGTWTLNQALSGWARVLVYIPDHGASDPQAFYTVHGSDSTSPTRSVVEGFYLDANRNPALGHWESLGAFHFTGTTPSVSLSNMTRANVGNKWTDGIRDVAWDAVAFQPLPGRPAHQIVALGDSYSSGEGASHSPVNGAYDYYRSSDHNGDNPARRDACHRSPYNWSRTMKLPDQPEISVGTLVDRNATNVTYHMSACSGAEVKHLLPGSDGQYHEGSQVDQGYLDQHTTLVTLSIGGNDANFSSVITKCVFGDCQHTLNKNGDPLSETEPKLINNKVEPNILDALATIHDDSNAPNARILLMGYPRIFSDNPTQCIAGIDYSDANWLNKTANTLDDAMKQAASEARGMGIPVRFADPRSAFIGKSTCGNPSEIHGFVFDLTPGDDPDLVIWPGEGVVSNQSFHPSIAGAATYARVATERLQDWEP